MIDLKIANRLEDIKKITLFLGVSNDQLSAILKNARIIDCKKNQILFSEEEEVKNFYIALNGLMKVVKNDSKGDESIIKIIDQGVIYDIFSNSHLLTCVALKDSAILTFSLNYFRELIKENSNLVYNLLLEMSLQNQLLISQLSDLKINNGKEKIGQFLLKKSLKNGKKNKYIDLEYSKNEIASYLGIRLETFSRILHQLKGDGEILINKNKIILTKEKSLCSYCDNEIASKCLERNTDCIHKDR